MSINEILDLHVQSARNRGCSCGWKPDHSLDELLFPPSLQHRRHLAAVLNSHNYIQQQYLTDEQLYSGNGDTDLPDGTVVESADGSVWWVEPDFGWDCVTEGSCALDGPARLLVMGGGGE